MEKTDFQIKVEQYLNAEEGNYKKLAAQFSASTVWPARLVWGSAVPHPAIQAIILKWIEEQNSCSMLLD